MVRLLGMADNKYLSLLSLFDFLWIEFFINNNFDMERVTSYAWAKKRKKKERPKVGDNNGHYNVPW